MDMRGEIYVNRKEENNLRLNIGVWGVLWALLLLTCAPASKAQDYTFEFLGTEFNQYLNAQVKLKPEITSMPYMFYDSLEHCRSIVGNKVSFPERNVPYRTSTDSLIGRVFRIEQIVGADGNDFVRRTFLDRPIFVLRDEKRNTKLYFKYDPDYSYKFPFLVNGLPSVEDAVCHQITQQKLPLANVDYLHSPNRGPAHKNQVSIHKTSNGDDISYSLVLRGYGTRPHSRVSGVTVYLKDGSRIKRDNAVVTAEIKDSSFEYSANIKLSVGEVEMLSTSPIAKHRMYIFDTEIDASTAQRFCLYAKCILKMGI
jgi:hypothetical protein